MRLYWDLFRVFFKIGSFTFGGGYAMISIIEKEIVEIKKWISKEDFVDLLAVSQTLPGILAVNISIATGNKLRGSKGAVTAALGTILPSFLLILCIAVFFRKMYDNQYMISIFNGIRPAVVALIVIPVISTAKAAKLDKFNFWIPIAGALLIWLLGVSPIYIIIGAGIFGVIRMLKNF